MLLRLCVVVLVALATLVHADAGCAASFAGASPSSSSSSSSSSTAVARIRHAAPQFTADAVLPNGEFGRVSLSDYRGQYVVLVFVPLANTFVCVSEFVAFSDAAARFKALGAQVLGLSVDSKFTLRAWREKKRAEGGVAGMEIPMLSDLSKRIARSYGVLLDDDDASDPGGVALRGMFLIAPGEQQVVRHITINDLPVGRSVPEALRLLEAFKYTDAHDGEVCPAGWQRGEPTMIADPVKAQAYFSTAYAGK